MDLTLPNSFGGICATLLLSIFCVQSAFAQTEGDDLEDTLNSRMLDTTFPGTMGGGGSGFTSRFDPSFNPAMGLIFDGLATFSEERGAGVDGFDMRSVEIDLASRIDPLGWAYAVIAYEDDIFSVEEAALIMDQLPANMSLRVGKMLADFGKWNTIHLHDKSFVFEDGVRTAFFGGNLNGTGIELNQWTGMGDIPVRWSLGVLSSFGASNPIQTGPGPHTQGSSFGSGVIDNHDFSEFGFTGRVAAQQDYGVNGFFQYGLSFFHTGSGIVDQNDTNSDGIVDQEFGLGQTTFAIDLTLRDVDASDHSASTWSVELWRNQRDTIDGASNQVSRDANGLWGFYEYEFNPYWGAGVEAAWWQDPLNTVGSDWFSSAQAGGQRGVFVTHNFSEFNRLRTQVTQDLAVGSSAVWSLAVQWDIILGSHSHPLDW
ncbi:MAG: hypothetical protein QM477_03275 [Planctomycetota bacterium]